jgi:hypothetical protein
MSKKEEEDKLKKQVISLLDNSHTFVYKSIEELYKRQTAIEQESEVTIDNNSIGFTAPDAEFLTSLAKQYLKWKDTPQDKRPYSFPFSYKQFQLLKECLKKYHKQLEHLIP